MKQKAYTAILKCAAALCGVLFLTLLSGCDVIYDDEGDCSVHYRLRFVYDYNMKWADAFPREVESVRVYAFTPEGDLVWTTTESGKQLAADGYSVEMPLNPGDYRIVAWCGADNNPGNEHFTIAPAYDNVWRREHIDCMLNRNRDAEDNRAYSDCDLHPLFHGEMDVTLPDLSTEGGEYVSTMSLKKDTNKIKVLLQNLNGKDLDVNDFVFTITDANGHMACDNELIDDEPIEYRPHYTYSGSAGVDISNPADGSRAVYQVNVAMAELTTARLMESRRSDMMLHIATKDGKTVAHIPVIDYALLVKGYSNKHISDQEYLDRQDDYSMMFFLDENNEWLASTIIINSWRIVLQEHELGK